MQASVCLLVRAARAFRMSVFFAAAHNILYRPWFRNSAPLLFPSIAGEIVGLPVGGHPQRCGSQEFQSTCEVC